MIYKKINEKTHDLLYVLLCLLHKWTMSCNINIKSEQINLIEKIQFFWNVNHDNLCIAFFFFSFFFYLVTTLHLLSDIGSIKTRETTKSS